MKNNMKLLFTALSLFAVSLTSCREDKPEGDKYQNEAVTSVSFETTYQKMEIGDSFQLVPAITYKNNEEKEVYKEWKSSRHTVANVDDQGFVTAVGSGKAYVTFRAGYKMAACTIYVPAQETEPVTPEPEPEDPTAFRIGLDATSRSIDVGGSFVLTATPTEEATVTWSTNSAAVSITPSGNSVTIVGSVAGTAKVTASANGVSATCTVTVTDGGSEDEKEYEVFMYIDYNNVDEEDTTGKKLVAHFFWYSDRPLSESGEVPNITNDMAMDPAFPYFGGWSDHPIVDSKNDLWDLEKDVLGTTSYIYTFYAIWNDVPTMSY